MLTELLGKKIGMTQLFDDQRNVVPVTAIDINDWYVTQIKTQEKDGYSALQLGLLKDRYKGLDFSADWLKKRSDFFLFLNEVAIAHENEKDFSLGRKIAVDDIAIQEKDKVSVSGTSRGLGFQGVVKRWNFKGGPASHGSTFHRIPGSIGNLTREGKVDKGKKLPGHCGCERITTKGLQVVGIDKDNGCLFVKGSAPGHKNSLLHIRKQG